MTSYSTFGFGSSRSSKFHPVSFLICLSLLMQLRTKGLIDGVGSSYFCFVFVFYIMLSMSFFFFFPVDSHPTLDLSDFPSLSSRSSVAPNPVPANRTYGRLFGCLFMSTQAYLYFSTGIIKEIIVEKKTWELY